MKILSIGLLACASLIGLWTATQSVAAHLHSAPDLGPPWLRVGDMNVYAPWAWLIWDRTFAAHAPAVFGRAASITTVGATVGCALAALCARMRSKTSAASHAHGSSRWATNDELERAGLLGAEGVVLGQTTEAAFRAALDARGAAIHRALRFGRLVRHNGPEHIFCVAPTRAGKGAGVVIPTLLSWRHSVLVYDIKKENWTRTAGWRRQFSRTWRFEPTALDSVRFNPLLEIRRGQAEVKDAQNVADMLVDPAGDRETRDHWQTTAHSLLVGAILHVLYAERDKTLAGVAAFLSEPRRSATETLGRMLDTGHTPSGPHPAVRQIAREMLNKSDNERSGVFSTAMACLGLYRDPVIARNTATSDFRITDLMEADVPVSLYLVIPPSDLARTRPLVRLMLNQIGRRLTESMDVMSHAAPTRRLLVLLDEFPSLGRLDFFETSLAFLAAYGLKALLIAQSLNQLEKAYGPHHSILDNCHVRVALGANDDRTAQRISDLLGQATEKKLQRSYSGSGVFLANRTESEHEYGRPLLTPAEVLQMPPDDELLLVGGVRPYRARKIRYYLDPRFEGRSDLPAPDRPCDQAIERLPPVPSGWPDAAVDAPPSADAWAPDAAPTRPSLPDTDALYEDALETDDPTEPGDPTPEGFWP
jgi:type IV secretion system protein VirD4